MRYHDIIREDQPRRLTDPGVGAWLDAARARPDAEHLYVHGSRKVFDQFNEPNTDIGQLIFASKLIDQWRHGKTLQAEYYGHFLYLLKIRVTRKFNPYSDPQARAIMTAAVSPGGPAGAQGAWDYEAKIKDGQFEYQDAHLIVPPAVAAGYDFFRVYEVSMRGYSFAAAHADMVTIVDRYPGAAQ